MVRTRRLHPHRGRQDNVQSRGNTDRLVPQQPGDVRGRRICRIPDKGGIDQCSCKLGKWSMDSTGRAVALSVVRFLILVWALLDHLSQPRPEASKILQIVALELFAFEIETMSLRVRQSGVQTDQGFGISPGTYTDDRKSILQ
jgi:hypothetical protein